MIAIVFFSLSCAYVLYVLAGYPALLVWWAKKYAAPVEKQPGSRTVSVIVPVYNGDKFLADKLDSILASDYPRELFDVTVVSDASTDRTDEIANSYKDRGVRLLRLPKGGKPAALNASIPTVTGEILLLTDVRQTLAPDCMSKLAACFADDSVGVASGELLIREGESAEEADIGFYWKYESWIRRSLAQVDSIFGATGPIYAIRRSLAVSVPVDALLDDVYLPMTAFFRGYRLVVEDAAVAWDYPTKLHSEFRRKVRTQAGNYQLLQQFPKLLVPGNRMWFHFYSYKLGRLLLPYALLTALISAFFLPMPWKAIAVGGQCLGYLLALLDPLFPRGTAVKRISSPVRTFCVLLFATVAGLRVFFVSPLTLWKQTKVVVPASSGIKLSD